GQLDVDAYAFAAPAHAALDHVADTQLAADGLHVDRFRLVDEAGVTGDDEQLRELREIGDDVVGQAVAEIALVGIAAQIVEGQHDDGRRRPRLYPWRLRRAAC